MARRDGFYPEPYLSSVSRLPTEASGKPFPAPRAYTYFAHIRPVTHMPKTPSWQVPGTVTSLETGKPRVNLSREENVDFGVEIYSCNFQTRFWSTVPRSGVEPGSSPPQCPSWLYLMSVRPWAGTFTVPCLSFPLLRRIIALLP